jgi:hypothetical protein
MKKWRKQYIGLKVLQELPNNSINCLKRETYPPNVNMPDSEGKKKTEVKCQKKQRGNKYPSKSLTFPQEKQQKLPSSLP